jgi:hypothetical protein
LTSFDRAVLSVLLGSSLEGIGNQAGGGGGVLGPRGIIVIVVVVARVVVVVASGLLAAARQSGRRCGGRRVGALLTITLGLLGVGGLGLLVGGALGGLDGVGGGRGLRLVCFIGVSVMSLMMAGAVCATWFHTSLHHS